MRDDWVETTFSAFASLEKGISYKSSELCDEGQGMPFINLKSIDRGGGYRSDGLKWYSGKFKSSQVVEPGDLILCCTDLTKQKAILGYPILVPAIGLSRFCISLDLAKILVNEKIILKSYLFLLLQDRRMREFMQSRSSGTTVMHLKASEVPEVRVALPPLPEQKRIVDLISSVDSYIEALQQQLESAKNSKSAYVNTIVSEIFARGKKTKIAEIAEVKGGKRLPKGTPWSEEPTDHRYIRATDIKDGIVLTENLVYVPDDVWPLISRYVVNQGDVVITIAGTIGQVGVIPTSLEGVNLTENAAKIVVNKKLVRSNYLSMLLGSNYYQQDIDSKTKKTTQPKLGLNMINSIEIPLPDLAEQDEIFSVVSQIDTLIARTNNLILETISLRTGLLSDLLSGVHEIPASYDKVIGAA